MIYLFKILQINYLVIIYKLLKFIKKKYNNNIYNVAKK